MKDKIKICLVNRNYPPEKGATGYFASQLVSFLEKRNNFNIVTVSVSQKKPLDDKTILLKGIYKGKHKILRLFSSLIESYNLIKTALKTRAHLYIILTDPPFLTYWASRLMKRALWVNWTMDIYPDAFAANGLVSRNNWFFRLITNSLKKNPPEFLITLGPNQSKYLQESYFPSIPTFSVPVGLRSQEELLSDNLSPKKLKFGYIGNLGEAHDSEQLFKLIELISESGFEFILSCSGTKSKALTKKVSGLVNVFVHTRIPKEEMMGIDIHVVTLSEPWTHICVPSKAITALQYGAAILFLGSPNSDTWNYVKSSGWCLKSEEDIKQFIHSVSPEVIERKKSNAILAYKQLLQRQQNVFTKIEEELVRLAEEQEQ